jgi:precorrin-3B synthase
MFKSTCPSVANVVARADGGLIRVRRPGGRIDAVGLDCLADVAERWGNGVVEITNRANLQVRGIRPGDAGTVASALEAAGLSSGSDADRRRNVLVDPLGDLDPAAVDFGPLLAPILEGLDADPRLDDLDDKFGLALDGGGSWSIAGRRAAVAVIPGPEPATAELACSWLPSEVVAVADLPAALTAAAVASLNQPRRSVVVPGEPKQGGPLGVGEEWVGAMPVLGRTDPPTLAALAASARRYSKGVVRLTPWRGVVYAGVEDAEDRQRLRSDLADLGLVEDRSDPASAVIACAGSTGCTSGLGDAVADAARVIEARRSAGASALGVHVSGCGKCCAHSAPAAVTLIATAGDHYDLYRGGRLVSPGLPAADAIALASAR